jgi:tetratricopeptide (TPR) repeat protein
MRLALTLVAATLCCASTSAIAQAPTGIPSLDACAAVIAANKDGARQVTVCKEAVKDAVGKGNKSRVLSYEYLAEALLRNNQVGHAIDETNHAIEHIERGDVDDSIAARAYLIRAHCHEALKETLLASDDAQKAEDLQRKAIEALPNDPTVKPTLKDILLYHAHLYKVLGRDGDAIGKTAEANKL